MITCLDALAVLLTNVTVEHGRHFTCRLVGVRSGRDAIGTLVTVRCGTQSWAQQLTAGDGNQSSNERMLTFGLGDSGTVTQVEVRWPS